MIRYHPGLIKYSVKFRYFPCIPLKQKRISKLLGLSLSQLLPEIKIIEISFTLYPAHCRVGRSNLVLRHSVSHSLTPRLSSTPQRRNGNINLSKYFNSSSGDRTQYQSVLQSHLVPLRHDYTSNYRRCLNVKKKL